jgi:hypothetical protein
LRYEWDWSTEPSPEAFVAHARDWRAEGFQIIGGCDGTHLQEFRALVEALRKGESARSCRRFGATTRIGRTSGHAALRS